MRQKSGHAESPSERLVKNIRPVTRKRHWLKRKSVSFWTAPAFCRGLRIPLDGIFGNDRDDLLKLKDFPTQFGGSGEIMLE